MNRRQLLVLLVVVAGMGCDGAHPTDTDGGVSTLHDAPAPHDSAGVRDGRAPPDGRAEDAPFDGSVEPCRLRICRGRVRECGDCEDNDGDGRIDAADPECLGPCSSAEDAFYRATIDDDLNTCRLECFFDDGPSPGDDGCAQMLACQESLRTDVCPPDPSRCMVDVPASCRSSCVPITPNGCDCFGCCEVSPGSGEFVFLRNLDPAEIPCATATLADRSLCRACTPVADCLNSCEACEVCFGRPDVPADCAIEDRCPSGVPPCGADLGTCPAGAYCVTGCCVTSALYGG